MEKKLLTFITFKIQSISTILDKSTDVLFTFNGAWDLF